MLKEKKSKIDKNKFQVTYKGEIKKRIMNSWSEEVKFLSYFSRKMNLSLIKSL